MSKDEEKDARRTYLLRVASHILGLNIVEEKLRQLPQPIETFCDTNSTLLTIALTEQVFSKDIADSLQTTANKHLISLVSELEENLLASVDSGKDRGEAGVVALSDEIRVWKSRSGAAAQQYNDAFEPLQIIIDTIEVSFRKEADKPEAHGLTYANRYLRKLMEGGCGRIQSISQQCTTMGNFVGSKLMTGQTWKRQVEDAWQGEPVDMKYLQGFKKRLEEVLSLKQLGPQIGLLLNERGVEAEVEKTIETAMRNTAVLAYNPFTEHNWKSKVLVSF
ncbi:hypothetical protein OSTOST_16538 [Ostertagia ostertagi]